MVHKVKLDLKVLEENKDYKDQEVLKENKVFRDLKVMLVLEVLKVKLVQ